MTQEIFAQRARVLTQDQREFYFQRGYLLLEHLIEPAWLERLCAVTASFVEESRTVTPKDGTFDLAPGHSACSSRGSAA